MLLVGVFSKVDAHALQRYLSVGEQCRLVMCCRGAPAVDTTGVLELGGELLWQKGDRWALVDEKLKIKVHGTPRLVAGPMPELGALSCCRRNDGLEIHSRREDDDEIDFEWDGLHLPGRWSAAVWTFFENGRVARPDYDGCANASNLKRYTISEQLAGLDAPGQRGGSSKNCGHALLAGPYDSYFYCTDRGGGARGQRHHREREEDRVDDNSDDQDLYFDRDYVNDRSLVSAHTLGVLLHTYYQERSIYGRKCFNHDDATYHFHFEPHRGYVEGLNGWHHLAVVWDKENHVKHYVDGSEVATTTVDTDFHPDFPKIVKFIGNGNHPWDYSLPPTFSGEAWGIIADLRIYGRCLTPTELRLLVAPVQRRRPRFSTGDVVLDRRGLMARVTAVDQHARTLRLKYHRHPRTTSRLLESTDDRRRNLGSDDVPFDDVSIYNVHRSLLYGPRRRRGGAGSGGFKRIGPGSEHHPLPLPPT